jgi:hypothetical protein
VSGFARKALGIGGGLIAAYLFLTHYRGAIGESQAAGRGSVNLVKAFQGR